MGRLEPEAKVAAANGDGLPRPFIRCPNVPVAPAVGGVDRVVEAPVEPVDPELRVPLAETGEHNLPLLAAAVTVAVAQEPDVRRRGHE